MICDTLAEAIQELDRYIKEMPDAHARDKQTADRVTNTRAAMFGLSIWLDGGAALTARGMKLSRADELLANAVKGRLGMKTAVAPSDGRKLKGGEQRGPKPIKR
jgi:hypothetical protein